MYKEKIENYVDKSDRVKFIINLPQDKELLAIEFIKENNEYFCLSWPVKEIEPGKYEDIDPEHNTIKESIDVLPEEVLKMFTEKWEQMIVQTIFKDKNE